MLLPPFLHKHPKKERRLKMAAGMRCEHCSNEFPAAVLLRYLVDPCAEVRDDNPDPEKDVLVLCPECHRSF